MQTNIIIVWKNYSPIRGTNNGNLINTKCINETSINSTCCTLQRTKKKKFIGETRRENAFFIRSLNEAVPRARNDGKKQGARIIETSPV